MSLRFFHLFFITLAAVMAFGCFFIEYLNYAVEGSSLHLGGMIGSGMIGGGLLLYAAIFYQKSKKFAL